MDSAPTSPEERPPVLIADGDMSNVRHVQRLLRESGVTNPIVTFSTGEPLQSFLEAAAAGAGPKPCVLFLDPRTPGTHGYNPVRWLRRATGFRDLKVVIFSSTNYPEEIEGAGDLGVHLFLKKHPDLSSLSTIVDHLCGVHRPERLPSGATPDSQRP